MSFLQEVRFSEGDDLKVTQKKLRLMMDELARINRALSRSADPVTSLPASAIIYNDSTVQAALDEIFSGGSGANAATLDGHPGSYYLAWANFTGVPSTFPPATHTHAASDISYDHSVSGLVATKVQAAIDELSLSTGYTNEQAQDAIGSILLNTATINWTYDDATPNISANVPDAAITFAKFVNATATKRLVARKTAAGGPYEECTLSEVLDFVGSAAQGDILYRDAAAWARLGAGTSGQILKTQGAGANPIWVTPTASSGSSAALATAITALTPTGYWKLDEASGNFADSSGAGNTLVASGTIDYQSVALVPGDPASKFAFFRAGAGAAITGALGTSPPLVGDYTVMGLALLVDYDATIFGMGGNGESTATNFQGLLATDTSGRMILFWENGAGGTNVNNQFGFMTHSIPTFVVAVKDGTANTVALYVNGLYNGTVAYSLEPTGGTTVVSGVANTTGDPSNALGIGHVAFFNGVKLTAAQILTLAQTAGFA